MPLAEPIPVDKRNCFKCGSDFSAFGKEIVCPDCKKQKPTHNHRGRMDGPLTSRQLQISLLVAQGMSNKEIAFQLHLSERTVKMMIYVVFQKTKSKSRWDLSVKILSPMYFAMGVNATLQSVKQ